MRSTLVISLTLLPLASFAIVDTTSKSDPGTSDTTWSWVGQIGGCSAVAIGPRTIITAKHVGAGDFYLDGKTYGMASTLEAPKIGGSQIDLRVVQLTDVLPGWYDLGSSANAKSHVTMVGYGAAGVVNAIDSGYVVSGGGGRRAGDNRITSHNSVKGYGPTLRSMLDGAGESALTGGDSGGGWFVNGKLVGISSFTFLTKNKPTYGWSKSAYFGSSAIDLTDSKVKKWVKSQILAAPTTPALARSQALAKPPLAPVSLLTTLGNAANGSSLGTIQVQSAPEPSSFLALGLGAAALLRRRRR